MRLWLSPADNRKSKTCREPFEIAQEKPADLPIDNQRGSDSLMNLKAAKQIDLTIAPDVLTRSDQVIK